VARPSGQQARIPACLRQGTSIFANLKSEICNMKLSLYEFAGLHILMPAIHDGPADAGRRLSRYWYRENRCQVRIGWQKQNQCNLRNLRLKNSCLCVFVAINPFNLRNPRLINDLQLRKITYEKINLFLQNKANFRKSQVSLKLYITMGYAKWTLGQIGKTNPNEPKRTQNKPKFKKVEMNVTYIIKKDYENISNWAICENEAKTNPISEAKMTAAATNRKTWKTKAEYSTIAMKSLKTMNEEKNEQPRTYL
jgi:hypothetical protein